MPDAETRKDIALKVAAGRLNNINVLWETTQAFLAVSLTLAAVYVSVWGNQDSELLRNALFMVLGFYFGRTNHARPVLDLVDDNDDEGGEKK